MKTTLAIITLLSALFVSPIVAADNDKAAPSIEERLIQTELSVTLKQYEKVLLLVQEAKLQAALVSAGSEATNEKESKALAVRTDVLLKEAADLRETAMKYDAQIQDHRKISLAAKRN